MSAVLERRARQYRSRMLIRAWNYRQRHHSRGVWFRLRHLLTKTREAYVISADDAVYLRVAGFQVEPIGSEIAPPKIILVVPRRRLVELSSAKAIAVTLDAELLGAQYLALVPFDE